MMSESYSTFSFKCTQKKMSGLIPHHGLLDSLCLAIPHWLFSALGNGTLYCITNFSKI